MHAEPFSIKSEIESVEEPEYDDELQDSMDKDAEHSALAELDGAIADSRSCKPIGAKGCSTFDQDVTFSEGPTGLRVREEDGLVISVVPRSQGDKSKVKHGWKVTTINGNPYSAGMIKELHDSGVWKVGYNTTVTFEVPS